MFVLFCFLVDCCVVAHVVIFFVICAIVGTLFWDEISPPLDSSHSPRGWYDAPALKADDMGVSMDLEGTDVAREAADEILVDDSAPAAGFWSFLLVVASLLLFASAKCLWCSVFWLIVVFLLTLACFL